MQQLLLPSGHAVMRARPRQVRSRQQQQQGPKTQQQRMRLHSRPLLSEPR
jgi:hypothetical protein